MRRVSKRINKSRRRVSKRIQKSRRRTNRRKNRKEKNRKTRKQMKRSKRKRTRRVSKRKIRSKSKYIEGGGPWWSCFGKPKQEEKYVERAKEAWPAVTQVPSSPPSEEDLATLKTLLNFGVNEEDLQPETYVDAKIYLDGNRKANKLCEINVSNSLKVLEILNSYFSTGGHLNRSGIFRKVKRHPLDIYRELDNLLPTMRDETITSDMMGHKALEDGEGPGTKGQMVTWMEAYAKWKKISSEIEDWETELSGTYTDPKKFPSLTKSEWEDFLNEHSLLRKREKPVTLDLAIKFNTMKLNLIGNDTKPDDVKRKKKAFEVNSTTPLLETRSKYALLKEKCDDDEYNAFAAEYLSGYGHLLIPEATFYDLRVKYPHLESSTKDGMQIFLEKSKTGFKSEQKKEDEKDTLKQKQENSWVGFTNDGYPKSHPFLYRNLMTHVNSNSDFFLEPNDGNTAKPPERPIIMVSKPGGINGLECAKRRYEKLKKRRPNDWWKCSTARFKFEMRLMNERSETYGIVTA